MRPIINGSLFTVIATLSQKNSDIFLAILRKKSQNFLKKKLLPF